jgi:hypothetical protein
VGLTILTQAGGGVYVALSAPARRVDERLRAPISRCCLARRSRRYWAARTRRGPNFEAYKAAGVADEESSWE